MRGHIPHSSFERLCQQALERFTFTYDYLPTLRTRTHDASGDGQVAFDLFRNAPRSEPLEVGFQPQFPVSRRPPWNHLFCEHSFLNGF